MPALTMEQVLKLDAYQIYTTQPKRTLFTLDRVTKEFFQEDEMGDLMQGITEASSIPAAISHFSKKYGQFIAMQFYMLAAYDEIWDGKFEDLQFEITQDHGNFSICMFVNPNDWRYVEEAERTQTIRSILHKQCFTIVQALRNVTAISSKVIWDNFFVHITNIYAQLLENPMLADRAMDDLDILEDAATWQPFTTQSLYLEYTKGQSPTDLAQQPIRKSCCLSKDIPGLGACGYCPLH